MASKDLLESERRSEDGEGAGSGSVTVQRMLRRPELLRAVAQGPSPGENRLQLG